MVKSKESNANDAVSKYRNLMGSTNPKDAEAGTIRKEFGINVQENSVHGSDSEENAKKEIEYFFEENDRELESIGRDYESGRLLAGEIKQICIDKAAEWLTELSEKRNQWSDRIEDFLSNDSK